MKKVISLLLMAVMLVCFTACGEEVVSSITSDVSSVESKVESKVEIKEESKVESVVESVVVSTPEEEKKETVKVASFNIGNGRFINHNMSLFANTITEKNIEIIGFQEVDYLCNRSQNLDTMKVLSELTGYKYYAFYKAINLDGGPNGNDGEYGLGILSKYPIKKTDKYELSSFGSEQRILAHAVIDVNGTEINFFNTHLSFQDPSQRTVQMGEINGFINGKKNSFLTGDFNVTDINEFKQIEGITGIQSEETPHETWLQKYEAWPTSCIDNIYYSSKSFKRVSSGVDTRELSDHKMLYAEFEAVK